MRVPHAVERDRRCERPGHGTMAGSGGQMGKVHSRGHGVGRVPRHRRVPADAAGTARGTAVQGRDPRHSTTKGSRASAGAGSSRAPCHRSRTPMSSCAPTSSTTSWSRNKAAIPSEWRARGYVHIGDIDVVGNVVYVPFEQPDYSQGSPGHRSLRRAKTLKFLDAVESRSTRTRSSPSTRRPGSRTPWTTSTATRCCATTSPTSGSRSDR